MAVSESAKGAAAQDGQPKSDCHRLGKQTSSNHSLADNPAFSMLGCQDVVHWQQGTSVPLDILPLLVLEYLCRSFITPHGHSAAAKGVWGDAASYLLTAAALASRQAARGSVVDRHRPSMLGVQNLGGTAMLRIASQEHMLLNLQLLFLLGKAPDQET